MRAAVALLALTVPATLAVTVAPADAAPAAGCARAQGVYTDGEPWAQRLLDPGQVWPLTTGTVTVAVLGTGIDAGNAQFGPGQVADGTDVTPAKAAATSDCDGRGTFAAGIIAARPDRRTTFAGMAPGARLVPVRYTQTTQGGMAAVDPDLIAAAIQAAVRAHAGVICVLVPAAQDSAALRAAVQAARAADALVVSPAAAGGADRPAISYPTAEPGVLAVGAVNQSGAAVSAESGDHLGVAAPGAGLVGTAAGTGGAVGHSWPVDDPAYAAAFVAGTAALVRAYRPELTAAQVLSRLERTAGNAVAGYHDPRLGWGLVNPYAAVATEGLEAAGPVHAGPSTVMVAPAGPPAGVSPRDRLAGTAAVGGVALAVLIGLAGLAVRRGRSRGWRPGT